MKSAILVVGLLMSGDSPASLVTPTMPLSEHDRLAVGTVFDEAVPADIQMLDPDFLGTGVCDSCGSNCGCGHGCMQYDLCNPPTDMVPHTPYFAVPKTYYYFRPYHWSHVIDQQVQSSAWGVDPKMPYSNKLFEQVYQDIEEEIQGEAISR